jgi:hypothetical protein
MFWWASTEERVIVRRGSAPESGTNVTVTIYSSVSFE